jgi:hypothetical protein
MISDNIQQKFQGGYKGGLEEILQEDDILQLAGSLGEEKIEYLKKFVGYLSDSVTRYIIGGFVIPPKKVSVKETGETIMYLEGVSTSKIPILPVRGEAFRGVVGVIYGYGGVAIIKDNKLELKLARRRASVGREYSVIAMMTSRYEIQKTGLYDLRKLSKMDVMLPLAIWLLDGELDVKDVGEIKEIDIEYNMSTGDFKIELCGVDIREVLEGRRNTYINMLHSLIYSYQDSAGMKCIKMEGKTEQDVIWLNTEYFIKKEIKEDEKHIIKEKYIMDRNTYIFKKEKIPEDLNTILSEKTLKLRYDLKEHLEEQMENEISKMFSDRNE